MTAAPTDMLPPENFSMVASNVYRSGFPGKKNLPFVAAIGVRSVLCLCPEEYPDNSLEFFKANNIQVIQHGVDGNKAPDDREGMHMVPSIVVQALRALLDPANQPILVHCNQGKHRTGCVIGCLRRLQQWSLVSIFDEYRRFAGRKSRVLDLQYIELFDVSSVARSPAQPAEEAVAFHAEDGAQAATEEHAGKDKSLQGVAERDVRGGAGASGEPESNGEASACAPRSAHA